MLVTISAPAPVVSIAVPIASMPKISIRIGQWIAL